MEAFRTNQLTKGDVEIFYNGSINALLSNLSPGRLSSRQQPYESKSFVVNQFGKLKTNTGELDLPFTGHSFAELLIDQLSSRKRDSWYHQQEVVLLRPVRGNADPHNAFTGRTVGGRRSTSATTQTFEQVKMRERFDYEITAKKRSETTLLRTYKLSSTGKADKPYIDVEGTAEITIDAKLGVPTYIKARRKTVINQATVTIEVPTIIECKRVPLSETVATRLKLASSVAKNKKKRSDAKIAESNKSQDERLTTLLDKITADFAKNGRSYDIRKLSQMQVVPEKRKDVIALLKKALVSSRSYESRTVIEAIGIWGTKDEVPMLLKLLNSGESLNQKAAGEALATIGDEAAAKPLIDKLQKASSKFTWIRILEKLGPAGEKEVLKMLASSDLKTIETAAEILEKIGGKASVKPLQKLLTLAQRSSGGNYSSEKRKIERALTAASSRAVKQEIAGNDKGFKTEKPGDRTLTGVDRDLKTLQDAIASLRIRSGSLYSALSDLARLPPVKAQRAEVADLIEAVLKDRKTSDGEMLQAVNAIGVWGDSSHVKYLVRLIPKAGHNGIEHLFKALGQLGDEKTSDDLLKLLKDKKVGFRAVEAFAKLSEKTEDELGDWLSSDDVYLRAKAVTVLGKAGGRGAGTKLKSFLKKEGDTIAFTQAINALAQWEARQ